MIDGCWRRSRHPRLDFETLTEIFVASGIGSDPLQGDLAIDPSVVSKEDLAHATPTQALENGVGADGFRQLRGPIGRSRRFFGARGVERRGRYFLGGRSFCERCLVLRRRVFRRMRVSLLCREGPVEAISQA